LDERMGEWVIGKTELGCVLLGGLNGGRGKSSFPTTPFHTRRSFPPKGLIIFQVNPPIKKDSAVVQTVRDANVIF